MNSSSRKSSPIRPLSLRLSPSRVEDMYSPLSLESHKESGMNSPSSEARQESATDEVLPEGSRDPPSPVSLELTDEAPLDSSTAASPLSFVSMNSLRARKENGGFCPMCATRMSLDSKNAGQDGHETATTSAESCLWSMVVRFKGINVTVDHTEPALGYETFGKKLLGIFLGLCIKMFSVKRKSSRIKVLKDVNGYVMPGSMTLVLGPPGSGKSTLLKVIGGKLRSNKRIRLDGVVLYNNNILTSKVLPKRPIAYITEQQNVHLPLFTVRETLEFAQECMQTTRTQKFMPHFIDSFPPEVTESRNPYVEYVLGIFGLKSIENQRVGTIVDGIKDSERNRLTTAEIAMGTYSVMLYDQPSSGQDSLFTYDLLQMLQRVIRIQQCAAVLSLVQVSPEVFGLFDRVILLSEGQVIYQGSRQGAESYFSELGYKKPTHVDTGAFLQDLAAGEGARYLEQGCPSLSIDELIERYKASDHYKDVFRIVSSERAMHTSWVESSSNIVVSLQDTSHGTDLLVAQLPDAHELGSNGCVHVGDKVTGVCMPAGSVQYIGAVATTEQRNEALKVAELLKSSKGSVSLQLERKLDESGDTACYKKHFGRQLIQNWWLSTLCLIKRQAKFTIRLKALIMLRLMQVIILGLFTGSLFYHKGGRIEQYEMNSMRTVGFISMMTLMLMNLVQLPVHILLHRPVFYKQRAQHFFGVSSYLLAHGVVNLPQSVIEAFVYSICVYFLANLSREKVAHYFQYWGLIFLISYLGSAYVLFVGAIAPVLEAGTTIAGFFIALSLLFSGFPVLPSVMRSYWKWMLYIIPTRWGNIIFSSTQVDDRYEVPCSKYPSLPFCLMHPTLSVGGAFLKLYDLEAGGHRLHLAYSAIIIFILVVKFLSYLAYSKIQISGATPSIPREKQSYVYSVGEGMDAAEIPKVPDLHQAENGGEQASLRWNSNLPFKPMSLSFHKLKFVLNDVKSRTQRVVLDNVSGYAKPGTMLAIVGSTRSGKTTLLNCIAGRFPSGKLEGDILVNGFKLDKLSFCRISGFAEKLETHQPFLTVRESLEFSASLRLGEQVSSADKTLHVNLVLELMGLSSVSNQLVGTLKNVTSNIDEVVKKLTIAVELAVNPSILFLQDPTSKLDAAGTRRILQLLQNVAMGGRTIISTLDHPSGAALSLFNDVLILRLGGEQVYFGPVGWNCSQVLQYFTSIPKVPPYDERWSPVTYILDVLGGGIKKREPVENFAMVYQGSPLHHANSEELENLRKQDKANELKDVRSDYPASYRTQIAMVFLRNERLLWRNVKYTFGRLFGITVVSLLMGTLYLKMDLEKLLSMTSGSLFPYMQLVMISSLTASNVIPQLGTDRLIYYRENRARMYTPILYPMSWAFAEVPYLLLSTLVFVAIGNGLADIGVDSLSVFVRYWIGLFLFSVAVTYYGIFLTLFTPMPVLAVTAVSISSSIWIASSGVSVPRYNIQFYKWLYWINPFQYAVNILTSVSFFCDTSTPECMACKIGTVCPGCSCKRLTDVEKALMAIYGPIKSQSVKASFVWDRLSVTRVIEKHRNGEDYVALCVMIVLFAALAFISFVRLKHNKPC